MIEKLKDSLRQFSPEGIALAFSGGVDSTLLLAVLRELQKESHFPLLAVFFHSVFQTGEERTDAENLARSLGADLAVLEFDPLQIQGISTNPLDRCYLCKGHIFGKLRELAIQKGLRILVDGTNGDDVHVYRPGRRALKELGVVSPLEMLGVCKADIRAMARDLGLSVASKPSAPCLATRFPYHTAITSEAIQRVLEGEKALHQMLGSTGSIRLRVHGAIARIELDESLLLIAFKKRVELVSALKTLGFDYVTLDLEGFRSGSMDVGICPED